MRASKEQAEKARQNLAKLDSLLEPLRSEDAQLVLSENELKKLNFCLAFIGDFLNAAKRKLPTEASYERDKARSRAS